MGVSETAFSKNKKSDYEEPCIIVRGYFLRIRDY